VSINRYSHDYETADVAYEISHLDDSIHDTVISRLTLINVSLGRTGWRISD
ncbi:unnamed protein product, partial [marine sediment metagenome]